MTERVAPTREEPVDRWAVGYTVLWNVFQKMAARYSEEQQEALVSGTAIRAYRLELPQQR